MNCSITSDQAGLCDVHRSTPGSLSLNSMDLYGSKRGSNVVAVGMMTADLCMALLLSDSPPPQLGVPATNIRQLPVSCAACTCSLSWVLR